MDVATGSLGQGLSAGVGIAYAARIDKRDYHTWVLMGDGESAESLISRADARLLDAKTNGRNAVMGPRIALR